MKRSDRLFYYVLGACVGFLLGLVLPDSILSVALIIALVFVASDEGVL